MLIKWCNFPADLVTFTEEIFNEKPHYFVQWFFTDSSICSNYFIKTGISIQMKTCIWMFLLFYKLKGTIPKNWTCLRSFVCPSAPDWNCARNKCRPSDVIGVFLNTFKYLQVHFIYFGKKPMSTNPKGFNL